MAENELSKYFDTESSKNPSISTDKTTVTFRPATQPKPSTALTISNAFQENEASPASQTGASSPPVPVCTLFQSSPPAASKVTQADPANFFDLLGATNNMADLTLESRVNDFPTTSPTTPVEASRIGSSRIGDTDRSRVSWIPPDSTRKTLISMVTPPPGTYTQDRDNLTMPGVVLEEDMKDPVTEAVSHYLGPDEAAKRKVLTAADVTQDDRGLRSLIQAGCYRAAVNLTLPLLSMYGQGAGKAGHPSKHTVHSIQLWYTRLALLVKLRSFMVAKVEAEPFGDMDRPDLFFQFYPELYGGRMGSLVPFGFRLLVAQIPMYIDKHEVCLTKLHKILATVRKMLLNLEKGLLEDGTPCDLSASSRSEAIAIWKQREILVQHSVVNCALAFKDFSLAIEVMQMLIAQQSDGLEKANLQSALGRILLQLGDVISAAKYFQPLAQSADKTKNVRWMVDSGLMLVADGRYKEALTVLENAVKIDSNNVMILNNMAVCLLYLGRLKEAIKLLENGLRAFPALALNESYLLNLANLYDLQSPTSLDAKLKLLDMMSKYRGDNVNLACLKLRP